MAIIVENVRVSYVKVHTPAENPSGELVYSCCILIPKDDKANLARVNDAINKAKERGLKVWGGKVPKFKYQPLRDGDAELASGDREGAEYKGCYFINASMKAKQGKPGVVDEHARPILNQDKPYSGCYCHVDINPYPYKNSGNTGIGWGLQNIMFVEDGDRLDGRRSAQDAFGSLAPGDSDEEHDDADPKEDAF